MARDRRREFADAITRKAMDQGNLIELGFEGMRRVAMHPESPPEQVDMMRNAFFAGAQHVFGSMMQVLDTGDEVTADDLRRMDNIHNELERFIAEFSKQHNLSR